MPPETDFLSAIKTHLSGITHISPGSASCCPECVSNFGYASEAEMREAEENDEIVDEPSFSNSQCESCGSSLGGDRYDAHGFTEKEEELVHLSICSDCHLYHANGDIPENWEG